MEENKLTASNELSNEEIKKLIYTIRGKQVMLDSDVAMLYHYETKNVNKAVKRNIDRFPEDFCFQLTDVEFQNLRFQFGTSNFQILFHSFENRSPLEIYLYFFLLLYLCF